MSENNIIDNDIKEETSADKKLVHIEENNKSEAKKSKKTDKKNMSLKEKIIKEVISYIVIIVAAVLVAIFVNSFILSNTRIPTGSMENTIMCGNRLFGNRLAYKFSKPKRGDIIIFHFPDDPTGKTNYIKRVIGLPGETVYIHDGVVYIDGTKLEEDYLKEKPSDSYGPYKVPEKSYFVLGDNRNNSNDARFWENTYVKEEQIIAKAVLKYWPSIKLVK